MAKTTTLIIEKLDHLDVADQRLIRTTFEFMQGTRPVSFGAMANELAYWAGRHGWFFYRGGSHIALHRRSGDDKRVIFVTEDGNAG